ncbi:DUF3103 family protein [Luteibacter aegosomatissinici]|uniref:DUF3103 family protein n=1 Tax=Luteibacter aegosomatissinici TaxID=2911539 RepID=UPI001FF8F25A|nr:DUF3103 family protein [Luteibacter aegosomatissinici]UPG95373.1 DUF3103 domain-containing protein [Luteibacter aegosomatissinici]
MKRSHLATADNTQADLTAAESSEDILSRVQRVLRDWLAEGSLADAARTATANGPAPLVVLLSEFASENAQDDATQLASLIADAERRIASVMGIDAAGTPILIVKRDGQAHQELRIALDGRAVMQAGVAVMNDALAKADLYGTKPTLRRQAFSAAASRAPQELSMLRKIRVEDNKENWFKGDAEIFAITTGFGADNQPFVKTQLMPFLAKSKVDYTPNMDLVNWAECSAPYVNLQLFDKDGDVNFQNLAVSLVKAVGEGLKLNPATAPYAAVSELGAAVLNAMDSTWFKNDPDYVDSFYVLERGKTYTQHKGAANNATITIEPYTVG